MPQEAAKDPSAIVVPFGKYKGATVAELLARDAQYADWIVAQGWVAERFAELHAAIVTRGAGTDDTPEHNALQARFLDKAFRAALLPLICNLEKQKASHAEDRLRMATLDLKQTWNLQPEWKKECELLVSEGGRTVYVVHSKVEFEKSGVDVSMRWIFTRASEIPDWRHVGEGHDVAIELKPTMGDDYPTVMRQMRRLKARVCLVGQYTGRGVSEPQLREMFASSGLGLVFVHEVEEGMQAAAAP